MALFDRRIVHAESTAGYWAAQAKYSDTTVVSQNDATLGCNSLAVIFGRTTAPGTREDRVQIDLNIGMLPGGDLVTRLNNADMIAFEGLMDTWWTSVKTIVHPAFTLAEYRWHERGADRPLVGPAIRVTTKSVVATGGGSRYPDQVANTCSFLTASRKHWGRVYLPGVHSSAYDATFARLGGAAQNTIATAFRTAFVAAGGFARVLEPVVWSQQYKAALSIDVIQVDDVPDVQRRRRAKQRSSAFQLAS